MKASHWLQGCGTGITLMLCDLWFHISPFHSDLYHRLLPMNSIYWGVAVDLLVLCVLLAVLCWLFERFDPLQRGACWLVLGAILFWRLHVFLVWQGLLSPRPWRPTFTLFFSLCLGLILWSFHRSLYSRVVRGGLTFLALLGLSVFWMEAELLYMAVHFEPLEQSNFAKSIPESSLPQRRIVWIVFDELSQDQIMDHRQADLQMPTFDRLRSESALFTNVQPAGYYTELVLPSLLWGRPITGERSDLEGHLSVKTAQHGWQIFPASQSIFADAQSKGWTAGVAGWYNPYCRTYAAELDWCAWQLTSPIEGSYSPQQSALWNVLAPVRKPLLRMIGEKYRTPSDAALHTSDYNQLMQWSHQLIADENIRFVFLHLPVPHPYGIYNRHTGQMGSGGSYVDNLAITDAALLQIRSWIAVTQSASQTTLIVCGDHSWRVPMWRKSPGWTAEDEKASQGRFDSRPLLMVHLAGETAPLTMERPFPALAEHDLIERLFAGSLDSDELVAWSNMQR